MDADGVQGKGTRNLEKPRAETPGPRGGRPTDEGPEPREEERLTRFYGSVALDPVRVNRDVGQIVQEVPQHFTSLVGAEVDLTLEVQARIPEGAPDHVVRTVTENCRTLKFRSHGFETH